MVQPSPGRRLAGTWIFRGTETSEDPTPQMGSAPHLSQPSPPCRPGSVAAVCQTGADVGKGHRPRPTPRGGILTQLAWAGWTHPRHVGPLPAPPSLPAPQPAWLCA